jgi:hypothetical protein
MARCRHTTEVAHETAHFLANHHCDLDRRDAETVAENAAFVVLHHFGLDTSVYIFPYVARWAEDKAVLKRNLEAIRTTANELVEVLTEAVIGRRDLAAYTSRTYHVLRAATYHGNLSGCSWELWAVYGSGFTGVCYSYNSWIPIDLRNERLHTHIQARNY